MQECNERNANGMAMGNFVTGQQKMWNCLHHLVCLLALAASATIPSIAAAQSGAYGAEMATQRSGDSSSVGALGDNLFGEQIDWYTGTASFAVTDVSLPGNNALPVAVGRIHNVGTQGPVSLGLFGNWDIDIPHISGTFVRNEGWAAPCSSHAGPTERWFRYGQTAAGELIQGGLYWDGNHLHIPGSGDRLMLVVKAGLQVPQDGQGYDWTTTDNWRFNCLALKRGTGEGFLAHSPDGMRYYFDVAFAREAYPLIYPFFSRGTGGDYAYLGDQAILRHKVYLYPSRIEDRFGNRVDFNWEMSSANDARLNSIVASDGRRIDITYKQITPSGVLVPEDASPFKVDTVKANGRTWTYGYDTNGRSLLTSVTLPDQSKWTLSPTYAYPTFINAGKDPCNGLAWDVGANTFQYTMTHPSGAQAKFLFKTTAHGRANVTPKCEFSQYRQDKNYSPGRFLAVVSLQHKEISGPGMPTRVWDVAWNPTPLNDASWLGENQGDTVKTVAVTAPGNVYTRYTFSNYYGRDEGRLLKVETGMSEALILSVTENTYDVDTATPAFMREPGVAYWFYGMNPLDRRVIPQKSSRTTQDGVTFERQIGSFDAFARPLSVTRSSSLGYSKTESVQYHDNLAKWVLGQVASVTTTSVAPAVVDRKVDYDTNAMPWKLYGPGTASTPGRLKETRTYNTTATIDSGQLGTLATSTDGRNNTTSMSDWKRGVAQLIRYPATAESPAGATKVSAVNDDGTLDSLTDENGYKTSYGYDQMGRLSKIVYPEEVAGTKNYNDTTISFTRATAPEYALDAEHWVQTVTQGGYTKITHYDGMLRPILIKEDGGPGTARFTAKTYDLQGHEGFSSYPQEVAPSWLSYINAWYTTVDPKEVPGVHTYYDELGRVWQVNQDSEWGLLSTLTGYWPGFKRKTTNPRQIVTIEEFQAFDEPTYGAPVLIKQAVGQPEETTTTIQRDVWGKPLSVTRSGQDG